MQNHVEVNNAFQLSCSVFSFQSFQFNWQLSPNVFTPIQMRIHYSITHTDPDTSHVDGFHTDPNAHPVTILFFPEH
jgi:hypothetical protein